MDIAIIALIAVALLALLGRTVWVPLPLRPTSTPYHGIARTLVLGIVVLYQLSSAYGRLIESYLDSFGPEE